MEENPLIIILYGKNKVDFDFIGGSNMEFLILLVIALLATVIGFYKYVYFISLGYGFSVAIMGIAMVVMFHKNISMGMIVACALLLVFGI